MKRLLFLGLVILIACSKIPQEPSPAQPVQPPVVVNVTEDVQKNPCESVTCGNNETCRQGKCFCVSGFKECNNGCIPATDCCSNSDCAVQESCNNGACEKTEFCDYRMKYDKNTKKCECITGTKWCFDQQKCIDKDSCCDIADCNPLGGFERFCVPSTFRVEMCVKANNREHCRKATVGERTSFSVGNQTFDAYVTKLREGGVADINFRNFDTSFNMTMIRPNEEVEKNGVGVIITGNDSAGGSCRAD